MAHLRPRNLSRILWALGKVRRSATASRRASLFFNRRAPGLTRCLRGGWRCGLPPCPPPCSGSRSKRTRMACGAMRPMPCVMWRPLGTSQARGGRPASAWRLAPSSPLQRHALSTPCDSVPAQGPGAARPAGHRPACRAQRLGTGSRPRRVRTRVRAGPACTEPTRAR